VFRRKKSFATVPAVVDSILEVMQRTA
jgi:hypothetical protein